MEPIIRPTARVLVVDAAQRILLLHHRVEDPNVSSVWVAPGGGLEGNETPEQAAVRELREEVGLHDAVVGPCVWLRTLVMPSQGLLCEFRERYYVSRIESHEVGSHVNDDKVERDWVLGHRWWSLDEIAASHVVFAPRDLAKLLPPLIRGEYPDEPFEVGI